MKKSKKYHDRQLKIGSFTTGSNVTGIQPPYQKLAKIVHEHSGFCFVDFAAAAPYVKIVFTELETIPRGGLLRWYVFPFTQP
jgi:selenocysteine lyase/cysteine desulfurase